MAKKRSSLLRYKCPVCGVSFLLIGHTGSRCTFASSFSDNFVLIGRGCGTDNDHPSPPQQNEIPRVYTSKLPARHRCPLRSPLSYTPFAYELFMNNFASGPPHRPSALAGPLAGFHLCDRYQSGGEEAVFPYVEGKEANGRIH